MIEKDGVKLYTVKDVMEILSVSGSRLTRAMDQRTLIPTDIEPARGKSKFRYLFSEEEIERYANRVGLTPIYERIEHEKKVMDARREVRKVADPMKIEDGTLITADNVERVFEQIQKQVEPVRLVPEAPKFDMTDYYVVKLGKGYIIDINGSAFINLHLSPTCLMDREGAMKMHEMYSGQILQIGLKEIMA